MNWTSVALNGWSVAATRKQRSETLSDRDRETIKEHLKQIPFTQNAYHAECRECVLTTELQLYHALKVWSWRDAAEFSVHITGN